QRDRFSGGKILFNSQMNSDEIHKYCALEPKVKEWFAGALEKLDVSARGYSKILKVARTIADIDGLKAIRREHLAEAMQLNNSYIMG
ncbi:MAG: magnesium chelatase, partial [Lachnospiraceae bacterium]|nr:magnesium chelatase [Lachnospiraceae bacterium]